MAWTQADIDSVDAAILAWMVDGKGARVIQLSDGTRVERGSLQEWREFRSMLSREVGSAPTHRYAVTSKGT